MISRLKTTILCVDDHWGGLIGRKMLLESNGYEVLEATRGGEGLRLFLSHSVDAVVLDYQMPGMNGDVVAAKMKRAKATCPDHAVILLRAFAEEQTGGGGHFPVEIPATKDSLIHASGTA